MRANTAKGQLSKYIETNYGEKNLSKKDVEAVTNYARTLIPTGNGNPDEAWAQLKEIVIDPQLEGKIKKGNPVILVVLSLLALVAISSAIYFAIFKKPVEVEKIVEKEKIIKVGPQIKKLTPEEKQKIDELINRMKAHIEQGLYTDPPENCAKTDLDSIKIIDPNNTYKKEEINSQISIIVDKYLELARNACEVKKIDKCKKWIARAKLFFRESEIIREFEREFGLISGH